MIVPKHGNQKIVEQSTKTLFWYYQKQSSSCVEQAHSLDIHPGKQEMWCLRRQSKSTMKTYNSWHCPKWWLPDIKWSLKQNGGHSVCNRKVPPDLMYGMRAAEAGGYTNHSDTLTILSPKQARLCHTQACAHCLSTLHCPPTSRLHSFPTESLPPPSSTGNGLEIVG